MKLFGLYIGREPEQKGMTPQQIAEIIRDQFGGGESSTGIHVTPDKALQVATVYACVRILSESMAQLPRGIYRKDNAGNIERLQDHPLYNILAWQPNDFQTSFEFVEMLTAHVTLRGNGYAFINRDSKDRITELLPFHSDSVKVTQNSDWSLTYELTLNDGSVQKVPARNIFHLRGLSSNGYLGITPIAYHRNTIGLSMATERHGANLFKNGARPGGVLLHPVKLEDDVAKRIKESWQKAHGGGKSGGTAVLEQGMKYENVSMTNEDAQYLETRKFQRIEIAQIYRIPATMLDILDKASTYASAEQFFLSFVKFTILPWVKRWEQAIWRCLLSDQDKTSGVYAKFNVNGMERGDMKSRFEAYSIAIEKGIYCPNDCRRFEEIGPREGGDEFLRPMNMDVSGQGGEDKGGNKSFRKETGDSLNERNKLRDQYRPKLKAAAEKVVASEVKAMRAALVNSGEFKIWLDKFGADLPQTVRAEFAVVLSQYAGEIRTAALKDVEAEAVEGFLEFIEEYITSFSQRWTDSSIGQLKALLADLDEAEIADVIGERLSEWEEKRSQKVANDEAVRANNGVTRHVWAAAGVTYLIWKTQGSKTCPFCRQLEGKKVGIADPFIAKGETLTASDGSGMKIYGKKMHAPIHGGCQCTMIPG